MPSDSIFPSLRLLQITFAPAKYQRILQRYTHAGIFGRYHAGADYWGHLPMYLISRCPFCNAPYTGLLDTHSLASGWVTHPDIWEVVGSYAHEQHGCGHFVAVQTFVNLNDVIPAEIQYDEIACDVPFVMSSFVPNHHPSIAVIHSLPICRIEHGGEPRQRLPFFRREHSAFVPRYTAYMVTYYAHDPDIIWARRRSENERFGRGDPDAHMTWLFTAGEAHAHPESWDLPLWVTRGRLQWIDPATDDLVLRSGPVTAFPYTDIQGYRRPMTIRRGHIKVEK